MSTTQTTTETWTISPLTIVERRWCAVNIKQIIVLRLSRMDTKLENGSTSRRTEKKRMRWQWRIKSGMLSTDATTAMISRTMNTLLTRMTNMDGLCAHMKRIIYRLVLDLMMMMMNPDRAKCPKQFLTASFLKSSRTIKAVF